MNGHSGLRPDKWMVALVVSGAILLGSLAGAAWATPSEWFSLEGYRHFDMEMG